MLSAEPGLSEPDPDVTGFACIEHCFNWRGCSSYGLLVRARFPLAPFSIIHYSTISQRQTGRESEALTSKVQSFPLL